MTYVSDLQKMFYTARIGSRYGCYEVTEVMWDSAKHKQLWTLQCIYCGDIRKTYYGKEYVKGRVKGFCRCQVIKEEVKEEPRKPRMKDNRLYRRWLGIKSRCYKKSDKDYPNYGGRGITMCDEWQDFWAFADWAEANGFSDELTIDRIDNEKGYSPDNCRWITREMQNKNKRNVPLYGGRTLPDICAEHDIDPDLAAKYIKEGYSVEESISRIKMRRDRRRFTDWCREYDMDPVSVERSIKSGFTADEIIAHHGNCYGLYRMDGELKTLAEWAKQYGMTAPAVEYRMKKKGMSLKEALTTPKAKRTGRPKKHTLPLA